MRAMLLAAGRGERLRPLTDRVPKALVEAGGKPLIAHHLERLASGGFRDVVVNLSHLGEKIVERLGDGARFGLRIRYSREAEPLETAGGIAQALHLLSERPFLLVNADVFCECDFSALARVELGANLAHLLLVPNPPHRPKGDFALEEGKLRGEGRDPAAPRYTYAGVAVVSPRLVTGVKAGSKAPLAPLLYAAADRGMLSGQLYQGLWQDVGTQERLAELESLLASQNENR